MKRFILLLPVLILAACGGKKTANKEEELAKLKKQRTEIDAQIKTLEGNKSDAGVAKITPVSVTELQPKEFNAFVEVQSQITSDENILATSQAPGTVKSVLVQVGQKVSKGQVLAVLDASTVEHQIAALSPQLSLTRSVYEKQENLWKQNIGTEVQLMTSKANYEAVQKQIAALQSQRNMYRIVSPISGTVDAVNVKVGDMASPGMTGVRVVSYAKLKAEASLGENYLGKVKRGDRTFLIFPDIADTIKTQLTYVAQAVDPASRSFTVQVHLPSSSKLHPNMSCIMRIANYESAHALVVPVSVIQKTSQGSMLYLAVGNKAQSVFVTTGRNANGQVEILGGLKPGDRVITTGYEELDNGQQITIH